jgi:hypothetical protein
MDKPTIPGESPLPVATEMMANIAAARMMTEPINSKRTASHRLALIDGK